MASWRTIAPGSVRTHPGRGFLFAFRRGGLPPALGGFVSRPSPGPRGGDAGRAARRPRNVVPVLTDYHLHLRPDEDGTPPERYFTTENVDRYLAAAAAAGIAELGVAEHVHRFRQALALWRHPFWEEQACDDLGAYCEFVRGTPLRLGIECDYVSGAEGRTAALLEAHDFDYVVGSVHFVGDAAVDHEGWDVWEGNGDPDDVWRRYFEALAECARSGLFDILAHPDLVKLWGAARPLPERDLRSFYEPAVEAIAASGIAVEVSTAGLRKPVGELYPARAFAEMCVEAGAVFALSSDAHRPEEVGFGYGRAVEFLEGLGVGEICVFERRQRRLEPLDGRSPAATD
jgi:histidinol-phosphatase (PHP family)